MIENDLAQKKIELAQNSILPEILTLVESGKDWFKNARKTGCNFEQQKPHRRGTLHHNVSCRADSQRKTPNSSK